jgi:hypothetical protein
VAAIDLDYWVLTGDRGETEEDIFETLAAGAQVTER